jgi:hypothetical protein
VWCGLCKACSARSGNVREAWDFGCLLASYMNGDMQLLWQASVYMKLKRVNTTYTYNASTLAAPQRGGVAAGSGKHKHRHGGTGSVACEVQVRCQVMI